MIWYAIFNLIVYAIAGIFIYRYGKKCMRGHDALTSRGEYYTAEAFRSWKVGMVFWVLGTLQLIAMIVLVQYEMVAFFSPIVTLLEWGIACELWKRYKTIVIYVKEEYVFYFEKKKWRSVPLEQLGRIAPWDGNIAFTVFDDQNERVFDVYARYENAHSFLRQLSEEILTK